MWWNYLGTFITMCKLGLGAGRKLVAITKKTRNVISLSFSLFMFLFLLPLACLSPLYPSLDIVHHEDYKVSECFSKSLPTQRFLSLFSRCIL